MLSLYRRKRRGRRRGMNCLCRLRSDLILGFVCKCGDRIFLEVDQVDELAITETELAKRYLISEVLLPICEGLALQTGLSVNRIN